MPSEPPYGDRADEELMLRDHLAIDRTVLANERTFMAYLRTALAMVVVGLSFLEFAEGGWIHAFAYGFIALGLLLFGWGVRRFWVFKREIRRRIG